MLIVPIRSFYFTTEYLSQNVSELCVEQMENVKRINKLWSADGLFLREYLLVPAPTGDDDGDDGDDDDDLHTLTHTHLLFCTPKKRKRVHSLGSNSRPPEPHTHTH